MRLPTARCYVCKRTNHSVKWYREHLLYLCRRCHTYWTEPPLWDPPEGRLPAADE